MSGGQKLGGALSIVVFIFQLFAAPIITYWYLKLQPKGQETPMEPETTTANSALAYMAGRRRNNRR